MNNTNTCPVEQALGSACAAVSKAGRECCEDCEDQIRQAPMASVAIAAASGYILSFLPIIPILAALTRLLLGLIKPLIFIFGIIKVAHLVKAHCCCCKSSCGDEDSERDPIIDSPVGPSNS